MASALISPLAIGIYVTLLLVALTFPYYALSGQRGDSRGRQGLADLILLAHLKSIDYRMRVRGPRAPLDNLVLLAADERAVKTLGRWPWSRDVYARAFEKAFQAKSKLLALDIMFSEPSLNPAEQILSALPSASPLRAGLRELVPRVDGDRKLAEVLKTHADRIVAGSLYGSSLEAKWRPETEFCRDLIFRRSPAFKQWDKEEVLLSVSDPYKAYMPPALRGFFADVLEMNAGEILKKLPPARDHAAEIVNQQTVSAGLHDVCDTILEEFKDAIESQWKVLTAKENPGEFNFPTYRAWLEDFRKKSYPNAVLFAEDWDLNTPQVAAGTKHTGYFNTFQDSDGTIREKPLVARSGAQYFPALALKAYLVAKNFNASPKLEFNPATGEKEIVEFEVTNNEDGKTVGRIPTDRAGKLLINYAGPAQMFPYLSFADLLSDEPTAVIEQTVYDAKNKIWRPSERKVDKAQFLKDKILVAGATAPGIYDLRVTPFQENFPGTETHLNTLENLLSGKFLSAPPDERVYMPLVLLALGLSLSVLLSYLGAISGAILTVLTFLLIGFIDQKFFFNRGQVVAVIWPTITTATIYVVLTFYRYLTEERGKKHIRQTFQKYVAPAIVDEILAHPDNLELGGRKVQMTIFFSDLRGFTTISEKLDPKDLSDLLNSYLTPMTEIVFKNRGTLDKYMGDAIMAFFGAPVAYGDHAKWACRCALESLEKLFELQREYERKGLPMIDLGIGLNTGEVSVGNMGSKSVRSYTVMGDAVNLASRLEGINKTYGTRIILSEFTYAAVKDSFLCREVDLVRVKGKAQPVKIYELVAELSSTPDPHGESLEAFVAGYADYHARRFADAAKKFDRALDLNPKDEVAKLYVQRCQDYLADPPDAAWDGVFVMHTK